MATVLMAQHGLRDWTFGFNRRKWAMDLAGHLRHLCATTAKAIALPTPGRKRKPPSGAALVALPAQGANDCPPSPTRATRIVG